MSFHPLSHFMDNLRIEMPVRLMEMIVEMNGNFLSFEELLTALICLDPHCPHINSRFFLIFRYYDINRDGYLNEDELSQMVRDVHRNESKEVIDRIVAEYMALKYTSSKRLTYLGFKKAVISGTIEGTDRLLRLKFPLFRRIGCGRKRVGPNVCL